MAEEDLHPHIPPRAIEICLDLRPDREQPIPAILCSGEQWPYSEGSMVVHSRQPQPSNLDLADLAAGMFDPWADGFMEEVDAPNVVPFMGSTASESANSRRICCSSITWNGVISLGNGIDTEKIDEVRIIGTPPVQ